MLKKCCFCFNLYQGSILIGVSRLTHWLVILAATTNIAVQIWSWDSGLMYNQARIDLEQNSK